MLSRLIVEISNETVREGTTPGTKLIFDFNISFFTHARNLVKRYY
jgi:hypothetical protein